MNDRAVASWVRAPAVPADHVIVQRAIAQLVRLPIGIAGWETKLVEKLPTALKGTLPAVEEIEAELSGELRRTPRSRKRKS